MKDSYINDWAEVVGASDSEIENLNLKVQTLHGVIGGAAAQDREAGGSELSVFQVTRWGPFFAGWMQWYQFDSRDPAVLTTHPEMIDAEYRQHEANYAALENEWNALTGLPTLSPGAPSSGPAPIPGSKPKPKPGGTSSPAPIPASSPAVQEDKPRQWGSIAAFAIPVGIVGYLIWKK